MCAIPVLGLKLLEEQKPAIKTSLSADLKKIIQVVL